MTKRCSLFLFFIAPVFLHASFEPVPGTARQAGLGESRNAVPNDVASLLTNPAGLVYLENPELTASYNKAITGLDDGSSLSRSFIGYASPHHLRYHNAGYGAGYFRTALGSLYSEETVSGSVAQEFWGRYSFGVTAKILRRSYGATGDLTQSLDSKTGGVSPEQDPLLAQSQETLALTGDMGALVSLNKWGRAGISLQNINRPNLATGDTYDPAPAVMNLGWAWAVRRMFLSANISSVHQKKTNNTLSVGVENEGTQRLGLRGGLQLGSNNRRELSLGVGFRQFPIQIDYAFLYSFESFSGSMGSHVLSLLWRFGQSVEPPPQKKAMDQVKKAKPYNPSNETIQVPVSRQELQLPEAPLAPAEGVTRDLGENYGAVLDSYSKKEKSGAPTEDRVALLEALFDDFKERGVDTTVLRNEISHVEKNTDSAQKNYTGFFNYYKESQKMASVSEKTDYLRWLISTFTPAGVDVSEAQKELNLLSK